MRSRLLLLLTSLSVPVPLHAQRPVPPGPGLPPASGARPHASPPDPCANLLNRPLLTLTLEPAVIYPDDRVTLRWEVRSRRPGLAWTAPVHLRRTFRIDPIVPDPAPASDSRSWTAQRSIRNGTFTLETLCGQKTLAYVVEQPPRIDRVRPESAAFSQSVTIHGDHFGPPQPASEVRFSISGRTYPLRATNWTNQRIDVRLPALPAGEGSLRVDKAGRLESLPAPFRSLGGAMELPRVYPGLPTPTTIKGALKLPTPTRTPTPTPAGHR